MKKQIDIGGVPFNPVTYPQVIDEIVDFISQEKQAYITTPNPEMVLDAQRNERFKRVLNDANLSIPDGIGILWASYYLSLPKKRGISGVIQLLISLYTALFFQKKIKTILPARVTGSDLFEKVVIESQNYNWKIFLLGAGPGIAKIAIDNLLQKYPKAIFAGCYAGTPKMDDESEICDEINRSKADILFVAYGCPSQELWISRNLPKLETVKVAIGVGGAFDFAAKKIRRAPRIIQKIGLEWLWRLILQPSRIKRIWNATFVFVSFIYKLKT
ncbi:WecB/TagA/CpsF family glycosyltransferase [Candidatus Peregrinibacteria bacterium]|nr:WecB/TagA/CpsF family glycosyltransferase [Candidatus Peregrinibacteria bacterium]